MSGVNPNTVNGFGQQLNNQGAQQALQNAGQQVDDQNMSGLASTETKVNSQGWQREGKELADEDNTIF